MNNTNKWNHFVNDISDLQIMDVNMFHMQLFGVDPEAIDVLALRLACTLCGWLAGLSWLN